MTNSTRDGLGYEELNQPGSQVANLFMTGSITAESDIVTSANVSGANVYSNADVAAKENLALTMGSPYGKGVTVTLTARSNISGGMFVSASGGLAYAAPASTLFPIGVAEPGTDVASGGTVEIITHGVVAVVAEEAVAVGEGCIMGAGAAQNTVLPSDTSSGLRVFGVLDAAGSEGTVFITL